MGAADRSTARQTTLRLTAEQERGLMDGIKELETLGNSLSIREMVSEIVSNPTSKPTHIGNHWVDQFIRRNPEISSYNGVPLESSGALNSTSDAIQALFQPVQALIRKFSTPTGNMEHG
jgi:hypothetical protein